MTEPRDTYLAPATNTKGREELPGWRDPERAAENWRACGRYLRRYFIALLIPFLLLIWYAGYGYGILTSCPVSREITSKESSR